MNEELYEKYFTNRLSREEAENLKTLLKSDAKAQEAFVAYLMEWELMGNVARQFLLKDNVKNKLKAQSQKHRPLNTKALRVAAESVRRRGKRKNLKSVGWLRFLVLPIAAAAAFMFFFHLHNLRTSKIGQVALAAEVVGLSGPVELVREAASVPAQVGMRVLQGDELKTGAAGRANLRYPDGTTIELKEESNLALLKHERAKRLALKRGDIFADVAKQKPDESLTVVTPHGEATVVGTQLKLAVAKEFTRLEVTQGKVRFVNLDNKYVYVESGNYAVAATGVELEVKPIVVARAKATPVPVKERYEAIEPVSGAPKELMLDLGGDVKMELVLVKAGEFDMGSNDGEENEKPVHKVKISQPYYIGKYDVTVAQFRAFVDAAKFQTIAEKQNKGWTVKDGTWQEVSGVNWRNPGFKQEDNHPVVVMTWGDAREFCKWATKATGRTVRLPTEAEWEYAARGPKSLKYPWGDKWEGIMANVADASLRRAGFNMEWGEIKEDDGYPFTSPGGAYKNSSWCGAYDMAGNVWQWCQDYFSDKYYGESPVVDPQGPANGDDRVRRGGGWASAPGSCRSARRHKLYHCDASTGFRVVVECGSSRHP
jgi:formylglycine-generating enzyme required for sulfatase activity